jgi:hypothetical protein
MYAGMQQKSARDAVRAHPAFRYVENGTAWKAKDLNGIVR